VNEDFRFSLPMWRSVVQYNVETFPDVRVMVDTAPTAGDHSDRSACFAYATNYRPDGINEIVVLGAATDRWRGIELARQVKTFSDEWHPTRIDLERIVGTDLLIDSINLTYQLAGSTAPPLVAFPPNNAKGAKNTRIMRLQSLFEVTPPAIRIQRGAFNSVLFEELESFVAVPKNRGRQINLIDCLALACGYR
jgi:hypothetical protein